MTTFRAAMIGTIMTFGLVGGAYAQDRTPLPSESKMPTGAMTPGGQVGAKEKANMPNESISTGRSDSMSPNSPSNAAPTGETGKATGTKENPRTGQ